MRKLLTAFAIVSLFASCQREISLDTGLTNPGGPGSGNGSTSSQLLVRFVEVSGADSTVNLYTYDAAKRLVKIDITNSVGDFLTTSISRNVNGIITKTVTISSSYIAGGIDSVVRSYFYNTATSRYTHMRYDLSSGSASFSDSAVFGYDNNGNINSWILHKQLLNVPYQPYEKMEFSYTGGNLATIKNYYYEPSTSSYDLTQTTKITYDSKINPLKLGVEGILLDMHTQFGNNNAILIEYTFTDPIDDFTTTASFTYNSNNRPSTATVTESQGGNSGLMRFYYN